MTYQTMPIEAYSSSAAQFAWAGPVSLTVVLGASTIGVALGYLTGVLAASVTAWTGYLWRDRMSRQTAWIALAALSSVAVGFGWMRICVYTTADDFAKVVHKSALYGASAGHAIACALVATIVAAWTDKNHDAWVFLYGALLIFAAGFCIAIDILYNALN